jgi:hypothetical protein
VSGEVLSSDAVGACVGVYKTSFENNGFKVLVKECDNAGFRFINLIKLKVLGQMNNLRAIN